MHSKEKLRLSAVGVLALLTLGACAHEPPAVSSPLQHGSARVNSTSLSVLYAGSMTKVMEKSIAPAFLKATGIKLLGEAAGSSQLAEEIRSGLRTPDIFISASPSVNARLMGKSNHDFVQWYLSLARDELVIAYTPKSRFAKDFSLAEKHKRPWYDVLSEKGVRLGRTDPKLDPKGVYALLMMKLAERYYHKSNLEKQVFGSAENPMQVYPEETLVARLGTGQLDAIFAYRHEAVEWGVPFVTLPPRLNLGDTHLKKWYASAAVKMKGKTIHGAPITFTITIPSTSKNESAAEKFVRFLTVGKGHQLLMSGGYLKTPVDVTGNSAALPKSLAAIIQAHKETSGGVSSKS